MDLVRYITLNICCQLMVSCFGECIFPSKDNACKLHLSLYHYLTQQLCTVICWVCQILSFIFRDSTLSSGLQPLQLRASYRRPLNISRSCLVLLRRPNIDALSMISYPLRSLLCPLGVRSRIESQIICGRSQTPILHWNVLTVAFASPQPLGL
jgi:hypothetical protein